MWTNLMTSTPSPTSYVPHIYSHLTSQMNFLERFYNSIIWTMEEFCWHFIHYPMQKSLYEKFFPNSPPLIDAVKNISLILNNNHFTTNSIKPSMPCIVDIGGIYVEPQAKALPKKFQEFLDSAENGAILFSMGSIIQAVDWQEDKRNSITKAFGKLKQKVIWKYENETLPNKPENVMISSWLPQRDILAHKNIKLFISHGGLLSTTEAIMEGIPILSIPIFGDQRLNMKFVESKGFGKILNYDDVSEENLLKAIASLLNDERVMSRAKEISKLYKDRPMTPRETMIYWVEYVIRNNGAAHLKSDGLKLNYFELNNYDILLTMMILGFLIIFCVRRIFGFLVNVFLKNSKKKQKKN